jgi:hypothetical protein
MMIEQHRWATGNVVVGPTTLLQWISNGDKRGEGEQDELVATGNRS